MMDKILVLVGITVVALVSVVLWAAWSEATFDYTQCYAKDQYRDQHRAAWVSYMTVNNVMIPTHHPARDWTERLYSCPSADGLFDKWRNEDRSAQ